MNKEQNMTLQDALQDDDTFLRFVKHDVRSETYQEMQRRVALGAHPSDEILYDYVLGWLDPEKTAVIKEHLLYCNKCDKEVECIRAIEQHADEKLHDFANTPAEESGPRRFDLTKSPIPIADDAYVLLATEFWEPEWAGQLATAADIPEQEHVFDMEDGSITTECSWGGPSDDEPAYLRVLWTADISREGIFYVCFHDPVTQTVLFEGYLGSNLSGEATFYQDELEFDPSSTRWAVSIVMKEE